MSTTTFDEALHPRVTSGRFATKHNSAPRGGLTEDAGYPSEEETARRVVELRDENADLWADNSAYERVRERTGEEWSVQARYAEVTTDPAELAVLATNPIGEVALTVAKNPATPASVLHAIATDGTRSISDDARFAAIRHPNVDVATLRHLWAHPNPKDPFSRALRAGIPISPNAPGDVLTDLLNVELNKPAGSHRNLPDDVLAQAVADPELTHLVISNPKLTDEQLRQAITVSAAHYFDEDDDDLVWGAVVAQRAALHPNASSETIQKLTEHPDAHVAKTARDRAAGDRIRRARAAAETEMREVGGSENEVRVAGDVAAARGGILLIDATPLLEVVARGVVVHFS